jgi:hypothetical protein
MKISTETKHRKALRLAIFATLLTVVSTIAHAVPVGQVLRNDGPQTFTGLCCSSWGETVKVNEPATPVPVVVTWSADYDTNGGLGFLVQLSVNGGPCTFYGSASLYTTEGRGTQSRTFHWIVFPGEGLPGTQLHKGVNTFTLCGGAMFTADQLIFLDRNTLSARTSE